MLENLSDTQIWIHGSYFCTQGRCAMTFPSHVEPPHPSSVGCRRMDKGVSSPPSVQVNSFENPSRPLLQRGSACPSATRAGIEVDPRRVFWMSRRSKHVKRGLMEETSPQLESGDMIARVLDFRGSNILQVELPDGHISLARMPNKFQKIAWVRKGGFLIIQQGQVDGKEKVDCEVKAVLYPVQVKTMRRQSLW